MAHPTTNTGRAPLGSSSVILAATCKVGQAFDRQRGWWACQQPAARKLRCIRTVQPGQDALHCCQITPLLKLQMLPSGNRCGRML